MSAVRNRLIEWLLTTYPDLRRRLAIRLGSADRADEALQDTYIRLQRLDALTEVKNPRSYLLSMATNIARNQARFERRYLSKAEVETLIGVTDETVDPVRVVEARSELAAIRRLLVQLPSRRSAIFLRIWRDGAAYEDVAAEFRISVRTVRHELLLATRSLHEKSRSMQ